MVKKADFEREVKVANDAIQYWKGFLDAVVSIKEQKVTNYDSQISYSEAMIEEYKERLRTAKRNKNARKYKRD